MLKLGHYRSSKQFDNRTRLGYSKKSLASRVFYSRLPLSIARVRPGVGPEVLIGVSASQGMGLSIASTLADLRF
jgi:hypothetical protein